MERRPIIITRWASQAGRSRAALQAGYVGIDERTLPELLAFAPSFARHVRYIAADDQPDGNWSDFFLADSAMVLASMAVFDAAERSRSTGDDVGRIGSEFGREGFREIDARAQARDVCRVATDCHLIFGLRAEDLPADADCRGGAVVCVIDVDEAAPVLGKFLMADDAAESPNGGLVDGAQCGSGSGLRIGGDEVEPGVDGVLLCERLDESKNGEGSELFVPVHVIG